MIEKRIRIRLPTDDEGMLERECPHCHAVFAIDNAEFDRRVHLNLRCPTCGLIERAEACPTKAQLSYRDAAARSELHRIASAHVNRTLEAMFDRHRSSAFLRIERTGRVDFGSEALPLPFTGVASSPRMCPACSFRYRSAARAPSCPVCR